MSQHSSRGRDWDETRARILLRDEYVCQLRLSKCKGEATTVDHIVSKRNGGLDLDENLQAACAPCNGEKGAKDLVRVSFVNERWLEPSDLVAFF